MLIILKYEDQFILIMSRKNHAQGSHELFLIRRISITILYETELDPMLTKIMLSPKHI